MKKIILLLKIVFLFTLLLPTFKYQSFIEELGDNMENRPGIDSFFIEMTFKYKKDSIIENYQYVLSEELIKLKIDSLNTKREKTYEAINLINDYSREKYLMYRVEHNIIKDKMGYKLSHPNDSSINVLGKCYEPFLYKTFEKPNFDIRYFGFILLILLAIADIILFFVKKFNFKYSVTYIILILLIAIGFDNDTIILWGFYGSLLITIVQIIIIEVFNRNN